MELSLPQLNRLFRLFGALRDEIITPDEFAELNGLLKMYPTAQDLYLDYVYLCTDLCNMQAAIKHASPAPVPAGSCCADPEETEGIHAPQSLDILQAMGDYEKQAEALELPAPDISEKTVVQKAVIKKSSPNVSKLSIFSLVTSLAALLFIIAYPLLFPQPPAGVASVMDAIDAKWSSMDSPEQGARLTAGGELIQLIKGIIKIRTDNGVHLILEAPVEFRFTNSDELSMNYGRLFVNVADSSNGFIVQTHKSKIIDIGTQFGVYTDMRRETELHVFEGKTVLIAGLQNKTEQAMDVIAGQARKFGECCKDVQSITLSERLFARDIESKANLIWRSERYINLADVVGGGNGLGTGQINTGVNPSNRPYDKIGEKRDRRSTNNYNPVPNNLFIDGVFVPNGSSRQIITSAGHAFQECPITSGYFFSDILHTPAEMLTSSNRSKAKPLIFPSHGIDYGAGERSFICLHANGGITFDLNAFRTRLQEVRILRFAADLAIPDCAPRDFVSSMAEFWILVDGQVRHKSILKRGICESSVEVEIAETNRFLTLVTTDGGSQDAELDRNAIGYDWCIFGEPRLILE